MSRKSVMPARSSATLLFGGDSLRPCGLRFLHRPFDECRPFADGSGLADDDPFVIDQIHRRPALNIPLVLDRAIDRSAVPKGTPGRAFLGREFPGLGAIRIAVDTDDDERLAFKLLHE